MNRYELVTAIAIERAEYELQYAGRENAWQSIHVFAKDAAFRIAKNSERGVQGITVTRGTYGVSFSAHIDWKKLGERVEKAVPAWKATMERIASEEQA